MAACILVLVIFITHTIALDNGVGLMPPMGWNSWNHYACKIDDTLTRNTIDAMLSSGLRDAGYIYVNLDDCWQSSRDEETGVIIPDPLSFPNGIEPLVSYAHSRGLKFGLYSDAGDATCQGRPGSLGYETVDANTYASWAVDYLKYDNCNNQGMDPKIRYKTMSDALLRTGRPIFYSVCEWGLQEPWLWAPDMANSWRTTGDIRDNWESMMENWDNNSLATPGATGGWNDPDMLEVGNGGMSTVEQITHFSLWCIGKAPLLIGCDVMNMSDDTKMILMNEEAISINQDELGMQSQIVYNSEDETMQIYAAELVEDNIAIAMLNRNNASKQMSVTWEQLKLSNDEPYLVRDLWKHKNVTTTTRSYSATVEGHGIVFLRMYPAGNKPNTEDKITLYVVLLSIVLITISIGVILCNKYLKAEKLKYVKLMQEFDNEFELNDLHEDHNDIGDTNKDNAIYVRTDK